jgi:outer membrane protein assembly factor BamB
MTVAGRAKVKMEVRSGNTATTYRTKPLIAGFLTVTFLTLQVLAITRLGVDMGTNRPRQQKLEGQNDEQHGTHAQQSPIVKSSRQHNYLWIKKGSNFTKFRMKKSPVLRNAPPPKVGAGLRVAENRAGRLSASFFEGEIVCPRRPVRRPAGKGPWHRPENPFRLPHLALPTKTAPYNQPLPMISARDPISPPRFDRNLPVRQLLGAIIVVSSVAFLIGSVLAPAAAVADWPMWRADAGHTAVTPEALPDGLGMLWVRVGTPRQQAWDDPLNLDLMSYDRIYEPVAAGGRLFFNSSDRDQVLAIDAASGKTVWSFFTDAPVRMAPIAWGGNVYATSDDGRVYCLSADTGKLKWQFRAAPTDRKVIGNRRLISAWPVRGGAVIRDGQLYFAAGIWPFMGTFIYGLNAQTGETVWVNDSTGSTYIKQPHSAPSFAGIGPQGILTANEKDLIVPGGRSVPAVFDRGTGQLRYFHLDAGGKGTGGSFVAADDSVFYVHTRIKGVREFKLEDGKKTAFMPNEPVLHGKFVYSAETTSDGKPVIKAYNAAREVVWELAADGRGDLILAGQTLYAAGEGAITAIALPKTSVELPAEVVADEHRPRVVATIPAAGERAERLLASDGKLFAVTLSGKIMAFAANPPAKETIVEESPRPIELSDDAKGRGERLLASGDPQGYGLFFGADDEAAVTAIAAKSPLTQLAIVDSEPARVEQLRQQFDQAGIYGKVTAHVAANPQAFDASPYVANVVWVSPAWSEKLLADPKALAKAYDSVRPYGGTMQLLVPPSERDGVAQRLKDAKLEQAEITTHDEGVVVRRVGRLPGSADWTHQHGDIANTRKSNDARVTLPLGILWFGGSSHMDVLPRHGHGPPEQVVGGRLIIQGINKLSARDVYTGRVLWTREFEDLGTHDVYYDHTYKETPLDPAYNQVHIPGANARGTNYVVTEDRIYVVEGSSCSVLDPATGNTIGKIELPQDDPNNPREWAYIGVYGDVLIGGLGFARYKDRLQLSFAEEDKSLTGNKAGFGSKSLDRAGSLGLVGFNRLTGEQLWRVDAKHSFWNNAIVAGGGKVYCLDKQPKPVEQKLARRGAAQPTDYRLIAFDAQTGEKAWEATEAIFGTWLSYSESADLLLQAGAAASDRLTVEIDRGMTVYRGSDGTVKWSKPDLKYSGPCVLHNDIIITNANAYSESAGAFYLATGEPYMINNPLTGEQEHWKLQRAYGCNTILASENFLTFRSGAAGFYDLKDHSGTGNFGGFKSGCTGNLVVAGGVLNAPDYTRTCSCSYQNQTSLAMVHMPDIETWTVNPLASVEGEPRRLRSLGINFGAPGHHRSPEGLLWVESPSAAGEAPPLLITLDPNQKLFRRHSSAFADSDYPWIFASGIEGAGEIRIGTFIGAKPPGLPSGKKQADADPEKAPAEKPAAVVQIPEQAEPVDYKLRLFFSDPAGGESRDPRRFDILIDDQVVLADISIGDGETAIKEIPKVNLGSTFRLRLAAKQGVPVLSGIELQRLP